MPGPTTIPKITPSAPRTPRTATASIGGKGEFSPGRSKATQKIWREGEGSSITAGTQEEFKPMSLVVFLMLLLPTAVLLDLQNWLDLGAISAVVPYILDFTLGLILSFGLWLAGNKDIMQIGIAAVSLLVNLIPWLRDLFPWTIAIVCGYIVSLPMVQEKLGKATEIAGELMQAGEAVRETTQKIATLTKGAAKIARYVK